MNNKTATFFMVVTCTFLSLLFIATLVFVLKKKAQKRGVVHKRKIVQLQLRNDQRIEGSIFLLVGSVSGGTHLQYSAYVAEKDGGHRLVSIPASDCIIYEDGKNYVSFQKWSRGTWFNVKFHVPKNSISRQINIDIPRGE